MHTRRSLLVTSGAAVTLLPFTFGAAQGARRHASDVIENKITVTPISHASFLMEAGDVLIAVDPVGDAAQYTQDRAPNLIVVTHFHGDHFDLRTLIGLAQNSDAQFVVNTALMGMLNEDLAARVTPLSNGDVTTVMGIEITAIPAYNTTPDRLFFHPKGRDNGYVFDIEGFRVYVSGDTEDIPEMRALENIDLAFICMNLPFTMDAPTAASAVSEFAPRYVYPYHYRWRGGGAQDPMEFAALLTSDTQTKLGSWYE